MTTETVYRRMSKLCYISVEYEPECLPSTDDLILVTFPKFIAQYNDNDVNESRE